MLELEYGKGLLEFLEKGLKFFHRGELNARVRIRKRITRVSCEGIKILDSKRNKYCSEYRKGLSVKGLKFSWNTV
jgi:hypothetical protein